MAWPALRLMEVLLLTVPTTPTLPVASATIFSPAATVMSPRPRLPVEFRYRLESMTPPLLMSRRLAVMPSGLSAELSICWFRS